MSAALSSALREVVECAEGRCGCCEEADSSEIDEGDLERAVWMTQPKS